MPLNIPTHPTSCDGNVDYLDNVSCLVGGKFGLSTDATVAAWDLYEGFSEELRTLLGDLQFADIDVQTPDDALTVDYALIPDLPTKESFTFTTPTTPALGTLKTEDYDLNNEAPTLNVNTPSVTLPSTPSVSLPAAPGDVPAVELGAVPVEPAQTMPVSPTVNTDIYIPGAPQLDVINFEGVFPTDTLSVPAINFDYTECAYSSDIKALLDSAIVEQLRAGGTGLDADVEASIYDRARRRQSEERDTLYQEATEYFASKGHTLPPGALQAKLNEIDRQFINALADVNSDILKKQADLTWQNIKETITAGVGREKDLMDHASQVALRNLESAKYSAEISIQLVNARIAVFTTRVEGYKAQATVYQSKLQAQINQLELYKVELEESKVRGDLELLKVTIYQAQVDALNSEINLYATKVQAFATKADAEKTKIEGYVASVGAYQARVQAKVAEYSLYDSQIKGELSKVEIYKNQIEAHRSEVAAYSSEVESVAVKQQADATYNTALISKYEADISKYQVNMQTQIELLKKNTSDYEVDGKVYEAGARVAQTQSSMQIEAYKGKIEKMKLDADVALKNAEFELENYLKEYNIKIEVLKANMEVAAQITASALSSVNATASMGFDGGYNKTYSNDETKGNDAGTTTSHIYSHIA